MGKPVVRLADKCTGHGPCPPRPNNEGSEDVFVNGRPAHRVGDGWETHCTHGGNLAEGSATVIVNGRGLARIGDPVDCGSDCAEGSEDVFAGD